MFLLVLAFSSFMLSSSWMGGNLGMILYDHRTGKVLFKERFLFKEKEGFFLKERTKEL